MLVGSIVQLTDAQRHKVTQKTSHCSIVNLIEIGKLLNLRYGHQDVKLWRDFERALIEAELESLGDQNPAGWLAQLERQ